MKITNYLIAFIFSLNSIIAFANPGINFSEISLEEAQTLAAKENKLIFIDAYADWCGPCKWMVANTFTDSEVGTFFKDNFISVQIDMESEIGMEFDSEYIVEAYPTLLFLNAQGEVVKRHTGALDPIEFLRLGKIVVDPSSSAVLQLKKRIAAGENDEEILSEYLTACLKENEDPENAIVNDYMNILEKKGENDVQFIGEYLTESNTYERDVNNELVAIYFDNLNLDTLIEDEPFSIFYYYQQNLDAPSTLYFVENFEEFTAVWGEHPFDKFRRLIVSATDNSKSNPENIESIYSFIKLFSEYNDVDFEELKTIVDEIIEM